MCVFFGIFSFLVEPKFCCTPLYCFFLTDLEKNITLRKILTINFFDIFYRERYDRWASLLNSFQILSMKIYSRFISFQELLRIGSRCIGMQPVNLQVSSFFSSFNSFEYCISSYNWLIRWRRFIVWSDLISTDFFIILIRFETVLWNLYR